MKYLAKIRCEIKFAFSHCEAIFHTRSVFHSEAISLAVRQISLKKRLVKTSRFYGGDGGN